MRFGLEEHIVESIISVFEEHSKVDKAYVFGSRAKGNYRPDSDIDIAIKGQELTTDDIISMAVAFEAEGVTYKIDLIDYNNIKEPELKAHIDRVGIEFYSRWKKLKLKEVLEVKYGKDHKELQDGNIPAFGSGGIMRYVNKSLYDRKSILIPRKGSLNNIFYRDEPFWTVDTMFWTKINEDIVQPKFLYYQLTQIDYSNLNVGSAVPSLTVPIIEDIDIFLPPIREQIAISSILSSLDDKIVLLQRQNKTMEQLAETLFRQWFVEEADESWPIEPIGSHVTVKRGGSPRPIHDYISDTGLRWLKISDVTDVASPYIFEIKECIKKEGLNKTVFLKSGSLVLSNSATPGIPKILAVDSCIHDGWLYFPKSKFSNEFLYLLFLSIREELIQQGNGSIFTNLKTDILKEYTIRIPSNESLKYFDEQVTPLFKKIFDNTVQIQTLSKTRDTLLPKLMSGEVRVLETSSMLY